ncbi:Uncharacterized protein YpmB [Lactobacillus bombicola]|uniref:Uncharacterized protein YpmB n=1 Tax=Lactobacillus bombicola TaxID=1505723 RepID=A0A1I1RFQ1_9LACO|nr:hypothetical protein [Lactobacillus bombicola]MCO6528185.1 hypothetical protein [Lactobacillus sp.]SFD29240.1 Uncharacterized protein YpmB [Lactobacillus bombicola]
MIKDDTKQAITFLAWLTAIIIVLYFLLLAIFYKASKPERSQVQEINALALSKTPIKHIEKNYHLNRGINSYALKGQVKKQSYYFIYLPGSKKAYLFPANKGVSEHVVRNKFSGKRANYSIIKVNLGWYKKQAVWEVTAKDQANRYTYQLYEFKNGKLLG